MDKITVLVAAPRSLREHILSAQALVKLESLAHVVMNDDDRNWTGEEIAARLTGVDVLLGSWGLPKLTAEVLARADRLRLIAYAAGSVKGFVTDEVFARGVAVTHAAFRIADSVAEFTLLMAMLGLRQAHMFDRRMKAGETWPASRGLPIFEIAGKKVGLLGMGYVGRRAAKLFQAVGAEVWAYDPYVSAERAAELGVRLAALDELLSQCKVVSVHLPVTDETHHLLGARELALIQDEAIFINTARSWVVDQGAMLAELSKKRFWAALDVFDAEPLPADHPLRRLDNVFLTPHVAGLSRDSYYGLMASMIDEIERFIKGEPLRYAVTQAMLKTMA